MVDIRYVVARRVVLDEVIGDLLAQGGEQAVEDGQGVGLRFRRLLPKGRMLRLTSIS